MAGFRDLPGAETASATLAAEGLENDLRDAYTIGLLWTYSTALGWIRLSVAESDLEAARDVLGPAESIEWPVEFEVEVALDRCPVCGSTELEVVSGARKTLALMLITMGIPLWFWRSRLRCRACDNSRVLPLQFRPDLVIEWMVGAVVACALTALVFMIAGYIIHARA